MMTSTVHMTEGERLRALFAEERRSVGIVAPFIKVDALRSLLNALDANVHVRCTTRWRPREVAAGVSDPEILEVLEERGNSTLSVVDELHAKLYFAGDRCLAGSANVTRAGFGESAGGGNIEVLVETSTTDPFVAATLARIGEVERPASRAMADTVRRLADILVTSPRPVADLKARWLPLSRRPDRAYRQYCTPSVDFMSSADRLLLEDVAMANVPAGLDEEDFRESVRRLLAEIPLGARLLESEEDAVVTREELSEELRGLARQAGSCFTAEDVWRAFVEWITHFFPDRLMKQEIAEVGLRRAQVLDQ